MNHFLELVERTLKPLANQYVPEGSTPEAVIHQWVQPLLRTDSSMRRSVAQMLSKSSRP